MELTIVAVALQLAVIDAVFVLLSVLVAVFVLLSVLVAVCDWLDVVVQLAVPVLDLVGAGVGVPVWDGAIQLPKALVATSPRSHTQQELVEVRPQPAL